MDKDVESKKGLPGLDMGWNVFYIRISTFFCCPASVPKNPQKRR
jgi:hypothetical protein